MKIKHKYSPIDFSIPQFQVSVVVLLLSGMRQLSQKGKWYSIEDFHKLFNKNAFNPFDFPINNFKEVVEKIVFIGGFKKKEEKNIELYSYNWQQTIGLIK